MPHALTLEIPYSQFLYIIKLKKFIIVLILAFQYNTFSFFPSSFLSLDLPSHNVRLEPPRLTTQMPVGQIPVREQQTVDQNTKQIHKGRPSWMCSQHNVRVTASGNTGLNTDKWDSPNPRIEIKMTDPPGIEPGPSGWKPGTLSPTPLRRTTILHFKIFPWC